MANKVKHYSKSVTQEESEQLHRDAMDSSFGRVRHPDDIQYAPISSNNVELSSLCKIDNRSIEDKNVDVIEIHFNELLHTTQDHDTGKGALLIELHTTKSGGDESLEEIWLPKKLCSNLNLEENSVRIWAVFFREKYPNLAEMYE